MAELSRYGAIIEKIFFSEDMAHYREGVKELPFGRDDIEKAAAVLGIRLPKNLGDVIYSIRYRTPMPPTVLATQPSGLEWIIEGTGRAKYVFRLVKKSRVLPRPDLVAFRVPDSTPEIIRVYAMNDEQALLAVLRYNRLIDIFLGLTTYSLQNHLRTTLRGGSQIEIDELYVGLDKRGGHYIIPVQAKGGSDQISVVQTKQDIAWCSERHPHLRCKAISAQFMPGHRVALFELAVQDDEIKVVEERHYELVGAGELTDDDRTAYAQG